jgi:WD40 repeat protein/serine/threonine protein kinase/tetratricopeptide (TPR) repeat protein
MSIPPAFDDELARRLPLPLAKLYRRAHNAKAPKDRHDTAFYLWEATLRLLASAVVAGYAERPGHDPDLDAALRKLARPALGDWLSLIRRLVPILAEGGDAGCAAIRELLLGRTRDDLPRVAELDGALRESLGLAEGPKARVRPGELLDRLVQYRNREIGHGALGHRPKEFHARIGQALLAGGSELLGQLDVLAGRRLVYVEEVRLQKSGQYLIEWYELAGESARRIASLERPASDAASLPKPEQVYLDASGGRPEGAGSSLALIPLRPLLVYDSRLDEVLFLNSRGRGQSCNYLCFTTGEHQELDELEGEQRGLLARMLGQPVDPGEFARWSELVDSEHSAPADEPAATRPAPSRRVGEFELLSELGHGNMGAVYRAWQPSLGRQVALKVIAGAGDTRARARFRREVRALGRVDHPHLVKIFTSRFDEEPYYFTMELVEGVSLAAVSDTLHDRSTTATKVDLTTWREAVTHAHEESRKSEKPLSSPGEEPAAIPPPAGVRQSTPPADLTPGGRGYVQQVVELVRQVAQAAHALHAAGVVHRDIKPGNIMVTADGAQAILMDLGLAQLADDVEGRLTRTRQFIGTLRYASPEQILSVAKLDARSDVYSLGVTLWELLTLRPIYAATDETPDPELMRRITSDDPERIRKHHPGIDADLEAIVQKCLEKDPARRYDSAAELAGDLDRWLRGEPVRAQPPTLGYMLGKYVRRHRLPIAAAAALTLAIMTGLIALGTGAALFQIAAARDQAEIARGKTEQALAEAKAARTGEAEQRREAERLAREARVYAIRLDVANGNRLLDEGDWTGALVYYAEALNRAKGDPALEEPNRLRLSAGLRVVPRLARLWFHDDEVRQALFSPEGRLVAAVVANQTLRLWDVVTGHERPLSPRPSGVIRASFSPDGRLLIACGAEKEAKVWDTASGRLLFLEPLRHDDIVNDASFSPDGRLIVTASQDKTARLWDASTGRPFRSPLPHPTPVHLASFSPDSRKLVTADGDPGIVHRVLGEPRKVHRFTARIMELYVKHIEVQDIRLRDLLGEDVRGRLRLWDVATGRELAKPLSHGSRIERAAWSNDSRLLVTTGVPEDPTGIVEKEEAIVWDPTTGERLHPRTEEKSELKAAHVGPVNSVQFSPDSRWLLTAGDDGLALAWNLKTGFLRFGGIDDRSSERIPSLKMHQQAVRSAAFSPDGVLFATAGADGTARVWSAATGEPALPPLHHGDPVVAAEFSTDGRWLLTAAGRAARLWSIVPDGLSGVPNEEQPRGGLATVSPDGRHIARFLTADEVGISDLETGARVRETLRTAGPMSRAWFSPDGRRLATTGAQFQVWDLETRKRLDPAKIHGPSQPQVGDAPAEPAEAYKFAAFSPDSQRLVIVNSNGVGLLVSPATGEPVSRLDGNHRIRFATFSRDGTFLAAADEDESAGQGPSIHVWDARSGKSIRTIIGLAQEHHLLNGYQNVDFNPDGKRFVTACKENRAIIWDLASGSRVAEFKHREEVTWTRFSPDGRRVVTADASAAISVWDPATGELVVGPLRMNGWVNHVALSPDGRFLAAAGEDGTAQVWDLESGDPMTPPLRHAGSVNSVQFSEGGLRLITISGVVGYEPNIVRVWNLSPGPGERDEAMVRRALVQASSHVNPANGRFVPLVMGDLQSRWRENTPAASAEADFDSGAERAWHLQRAEECGALHAWFAERWHVDRLLAMKPTARLWERRGVLSRDLDEFEQSLTDLGEAAKVAPGDASIILETSLTYCRMGDDMRRRLFEKKDAHPDTKAVAPVLEVYRAGAKLLSALGAKGYNPRAILDSYLDSYSELGRQLCEANRLDIAGIAFEEMVKLSEDWSPGDAQDREFGSRRATLLGEFGLALIKAGDRKTAEAVMGQTMGLFRKLAPAIGRDPLVASGFEILQLLIVGSVKGKDTAAAVKRCREILESAESLAEAERQPATAFSRVAEVLAQAGRQSATVFNRLGAYDRLGRVSHAMGRVDEARGFLVRCLTLSDELARAAGNDAQAREAHAERCLNLGRFRLRLGDAGPARELADRAMKNYESLLEAGRATVEVRRGMADARVLRADAAHEGWDFDAAYPDYLEALKILQAPADAAPKDVTRQVEYAGVCVKVAAAATRALAIPVAREWAQRGVDRLAALADAGKLTAPSDQDLLQRLRRLRAGCERVEAAIADREAALQAGADQSFELMAHPALLLARRGRHDDALAAVEALRARGPADPETLFQVAQCYALLPGVIRRGRPDDQLTPDERTRRDDYVSRALSALNQALDRNLTDPARLLKDELLDGIRGAPGFRLLVHRLDAREPSS